MENQIDTIHQTTATPFVEFDYSKGTLKISGKIISENPLDFFEQLDAMLEKYIQNGQSSLSAHIDLDYFNSVSSKSFLKFLRKMISSHEGEGKVTINWYYQKDDVELKEAGEDYAFILQYPFNIVESNNN